MNYELIMLAQVGITLDESIRRISDSITNYDGGEAVEAGVTPERSVNYQLIMLAQL